MSKRVSTWSPALAGLTLASVAAMSCGAGVRLHPLGMTADASAPVEDLGLADGAPGSDGAPDQVEVSQAGWADAPPAPLDSHGPADAPEPSLDAPEPSPDAPPDGPERPFPAGTRCQANADCASQTCAVRCCASSCTAGYEECDEAGVCREANGRPCTHDSECHSSFCVDGRCCSVRACPDCMFCRGPDGTCAQLPAPPYGEYCGTRNACDGAGLCRKPVGQACQNAGECLSARCQGRSCDCLLCPSTEIVDFGTVWLGARARARVMVRNATGVEQSLQIWATAGPVGRFDLVGDACQRGPLQPGETCALEIDFVPLEIGWERGNVVLEGPTPAGRLSLHGAAVSIESPILTPTPHDFGSVPLGTESSPVDFTLHNPFTGQRREVGPPALQGRDGGSFAIRGSNCPPALSPGERCNISVAFRPAAAGAQVATLSVGAVTAGLGGVGL